MSAKAIKGSSKRKYLKRALALVIVGAVFITSAFSVAAFSTTVDVTADGKTITVTSITQETNELLEKAGVELGAKDEVVRSENENSRTNIKVLRAFNVTVTANKHTQSLTFTQGTVEDALKAAKVELKKEDTVYPAKSEKLTPNMEISIDTFYTVMLNVDGKSQNVQVPKGTVENALKYLNVKLGKDDELSLKKTDEIKNGLKITIQRVSYKDVKSTKTIDFETVKTESPSIEKGKEETTIKGVLGEKQIITRQKFVDGKITAEKIISEEVTKKPINKEVTIGTKGSEESAEINNTQEVGSTDNSYYQTVGGTSYTNDDLYCLAAAIWQEAGSLYASDTLQLYVANVVMNHVESPSFPNTIRGVLSRNGAYGTMAWDGIKIPEASDSGTQQAIDRCFANAKRILDGERFMPSNVIYQTNQVMGSGLYDVVEGVYFSYQ